MNRLNGNEIEDLHSGLADMDTQAKAATYVVELEKLVQKWQVAYAECQNWMNYHAECAANLDRGLTKAYAQIAGLEEQLGYSVAGDAT